jgi:hypothetical protein
MLGGAPGAVVPAHAGNDGGFGICPKGLNPDAAIPQIGDMLLKRAA